MPNNGRVGNGFAWASSLDPLAGSPGTTITHKHARQADIDFEREWWGNRRRLSLLLSARKTSDLPEIATTQPFARATVELQIDVGD